MHKPAFALALLLIFNGAVYCNDQTSDEIWNTWVPSGWKLLSHAVGNLDQDSTEDAVLVLEEDNPNKRSDTLIGNTTQRSNYNARRLTILIKATSGHRKIVDTDKFLPSQNRESDPCSLFMLKGIEIHHEKLIVSLHHEFACGSGNGTDSKFVFRLQSQRFRLIGFDSTHSSRELNRALSINYLTGDKIITLDNVEDTAPTISRSKIPKSDKIFFLDEMDSAQCHEWSAHIATNKCGLNNRN